MEQTIEQKVAETILQQRVKVTVGGKEYQAAPPSTATLILVSEAVSRLPHIKLDESKVVSECIAYAKDCRFLGDIAAILILGARHIKDTIKTPHTSEKRYLWGLVKRQRTTYTETSEKDHLARLLLEEQTPQELHSLIARLLQSMDLGDFFALTTFLTEINLLRKTKVEN